MNKVSSSTIARNLFCSVYHGIWEVIIVKGILYIAQ